MNYIPVRKENYADSGGQETTYDDVEDLDDQQFIVHGPSIHAIQNKHSEEHSDDDVPKDGVFFINSFDDENTDTKEGGAPDYTNMDPTIDVSSTPTLRIHKIHPQSQIIDKSTAVVLTRRKLKESASDQHQALLTIFNSGQWSGDNHRYDDQLQEDVPIAGRRLVSCNARNKQLWLISSTKAEYVRSMQVVVASSYFGCKINS
ncbi:hypothetical protein Tco_0724176 [Tanacetum coccineum]